MRQILVLALAAAVILGCTSQVKEDNIAGMDAGPTDLVVHGDLEGTAGKQAEGRSYSLSEVALHDSEEDCWLAINSGVYDVTDFVVFHPGGRALLEGCGRDASELFETRPMGSGTPHSDRARGVMEDYYIGELV